MQATTPETSDSDRSRRRFPSTAFLRGAAIAFGGLVGVAVFFVDGLAALLMLCPEPGDAYEPSALCRTTGAAIDYIELCIVAIGTAAPVAGGILTGNGRTPLWLLAGTAVAIVMTVLIFVLAGEQAPTLR